MSRRLYAALLVGAATWLTACSATGVLNVLEPHSHVGIIHDLSYEPGLRGHLDLYRPRTAQDRTPVVLFIYGGSWDRGGKADYAFVGEALASRGFLTLIPDYRLYPEVRWPTFLQDNARAVRWAYDHAAEFGGDPKRLFLLGHSAGAYDALMLALDPRWLAEVHLSPVRDLRGVAGLAGPYDFLPLKSLELEDIFGTPEGRPATQPINFVTGVNPPLLLATDTADKFVNPTNTTRLAAKVRISGGGVQVHYYRGLNHALLLGAFAAPLRALAPVFRDVVQFFNAQKTACGGVSVEQGVP